MIGELVEATGRDRVPPETSAHHLRHTFARRYLAQYPDDIVGLAELLGHSSLETTRLYTKPTGKQLSSRVEQIDINAYS
ncbi:tyrosine-type recombinase/integrase [Ktedonospora formicarum]|nr:tyrosine-type recombinase/integrase [Ktedonospora formicarum]